MIHKIPLEIQVEIMKRLPIKSLIKVRRVSKTWKSLIESSHFIIAHQQHQQHTQLPRLFVNLEDPDPKSFSVVVDDDTFPRQEVYPSIPLLVNKLKCQCVIGSSHGLLCLYGTYERHGGSETRMVVIWNVSIRKAVAVVEPVPVYEMYETVLGFGVCRETADPKIVRITPIRYQKDRREVEVFTLSTGAWRSSYGYLPRQSIRIESSNQVVVDGFLYWLASRWITLDSKRMSYYLIISFDLTSEEFRELNLPGRAGAAGNRVLLLTVSKLKESLVLFEPESHPNNQVYHVWMMKDCAFTKLFTVHTPETIIGITNSGKPIFIVSGPRRGLQWYYLLAVYEPSSKQFKNLGIGGCCVFSVYPYIETIHMLDQPDSIIYDQGKRYILKDSRLIPKLWRLCKKTITQIYRRG